MAYVPVPKDFSKIKTKLALNLTKRQIICFSLAGICGVPVYLLTKAGLGTDVAATLMIIVMLPFFFFAMYEKDGFPAEKILLHIIRQKFLRPGIRVYRSQNLYDRIIEYDKLEKEGAWLEKKAKEAREARNPFHFFKKADRKNKKQKTGLTKEEKKASERTSDDKSGESEEEEAFYSAGYDSI